MNHIGVIAKAEELDKRRIKSYPYISIKDELHKLKLTEHKED